MDAQSRAAVLVVAIDMTLAGRRRTQLAFRMQTTACWLKSKVATERRSVKDCIYGSSSGGQVAEPQHAPARSTLQRHSTPEAPHADYVAYAAMVASQRSSRATRMLKAERESMMKNHTLLQPWDTIHESNPWEILDCHEKITLGVPDHGRLLSTTTCCRDSGKPLPQGAAGATSTQISKAPSTSGSPTPDRLLTAQAMVKAFIARQLKACDGRRIAFGHEPKSFKVVLLKCGILRHLGPIIEFDVSV